MLYIRQTEFECRHHRRAKKTLNCLNLMFFNRLNLFWFLFTCIVIIFSTRNFHWKISVYNFSEFEKKGKQYCNKSIRMWWHSFCRLLFKSLEQFFVLLFLLWTCFLSTLKFPTRKSIILYSKFVFVNFYFYINSQIIQNQK